MARLRGGGTDVAAGRQFVRQGSVAPAFQRLWRDAHILMDARGPAGVVRPYDHASRQLLDFAGTVNRTPSPHGGALTMANGLGNYIDVSLPRPFNPSSSDWVLIAHFHTTDNLYVGNRQNILHQEDGSGTGRIWLYIDNPPHLVRTFIDGSGIQVAPALAANTAYTIVFTHRQADHRVLCFLNGVQTFSRTRNVTSNDSPNFRIGNHKSSTNNAFEQKLEMLVMAELFMPDPPALLFADPLGIFRPWRRVAAPSGDNTVASVAATATAAAQAPTPTIDVPSAAATATAAAQAPVPVVAVVSVAATATAAAQVPVITGTGGATVVSVTATATGAANAPTAAVSVDSEEATATAAAQAPTPSVAAASVAATATGAAQVPTAVVDDTIASAVATATAAAQTPTPLITVVTVAATATAAAQAPTAAVVTDATVVAVTATATAAAQVPAGVGAGGTPRTASFTVAARTDGSFEGSTRVGEAATIATQVAPEGTLQEGEE